ncbi:unnamed protein product [Symbiodinium necroappetens]|uniref:Uncharacterized protein n=1 Tax=Symbiodinium necroappetens TaxID=1628268 RepID=A0A812KFD7_9DINO|nr:unnamed protein product [Symbiodinium necroappetens]
MPGSCTACTGEVAIPPVGTRVAYTLVMDNKTGRPRAESVRPEGTGMATPAPNAGLGLDYAGTIQQRGEKYGFILQDDGQKMFVMPISCASFGSVIPPEGTRVSYRVVLDSKTGRPRAEDVCPEGTAIARKDVPGEKGANGWNMGKGGNSKGFAARYAPY